VNWCARERSPRFPRARGDRGVALVEFALILPIIAMLSIGVIDFGRWYHEWVQVKSAAREGALYAQVHPLQQRPSGAPCSAGNSIQARALGDFAGGSIDPTLVVIVRPDVRTTSPASATGCLVAFEPTSNPIPPGSTITVTVRRDMKLFTPLMSGLLGDIKITASADVLVQG
jgi:Flp pilus assembly pilin Flp